MIDLDPVDVALDLLSRCPSDPSKIDGDHLAALESAAEVVTRQTLTTVDRMKALAARLVATDDFDVDAALEERDELVLRLERHRRAGELLDDYLQPALDALGRTATDLHRGDTTNNTPHKEGPSA